MAATTDPTTGVTTVDEFVVTAPSPSQDAQPPGLQQASWRGIPFAVAAAPTRLGRRNAVHEYPFRDTPNVEDLGLAAGRFQITGFLVSNSLVYGGGDVSDQRVAFVNAAKVSGPGTLVHPTLGSLQVSLDTLTINDGIEAGTYTELVFSFIQAGQILYPSSAPQTQAGTGAAASAMDAAAASDFSAAITPQLTGGAAIQGVVAEAASWGAQAVGLGEDAAGLFNLASQLTGPYGRYFNGANQGGLGVAQPTVYGPTVTVDTLAAQAAANRAALAAATGAEATTAGQLGLPGNLPTDMATAAQTATAAVVATTADPADTIRVLGTLAAFSTGTSSAIASAVGDLHHRAAVTALARASALYQPASSNDANAVRLTVTAALDVEITVAGDEGDDASFSALRALRAAVVLDLNTRGAALPAIVTFTEPSALPSLVIANALYRDASRADQLVTEADPVHPLFMPLSFQALAA